MWSRGTKAPCCKHTHERACSNNRTQIIIVIHTLAHTEQQSLMAVLAGASDFYKYEFLASICGTVGDDEMMIGVQRDEDKNVSAADSAE